MASSTSTSAPASSPKWHRKPFHGSCHCGHIKYILYMTLPGSSSSSTEAASASSSSSEAAMDAWAFSKATGQSIYKCNCTVCHKMGIFHFRPANGPNDFLLLSPAMDPSEPGSGMRGYKCNAMKSSWFFCETCGVRCITFRGASETVDLELPADLLRGVGVEVASVHGEDEKKKMMQKVKVWKPKAEGWSDIPPESSYLSVNMITLDVDQEGLDLREIADKGWLGYVEYLKSSNGINGAGLKPFAGGMY